MKLITTILVFLLTISLWATDNSKTVAEESISLKNEVIRFSLLEGYFRTNAFYRGNFDLDSYSLQGDGNVYGTSRYNPSLEELNGIASDISTVSYNLRFRLSPSIQVGEYLKAVTTFDIFDNTLFGDSSQSKFFGKEGYLVAKSPFGLFKIGRMATNWGLGIYRNDGKEKFSNYGTYIDQVVFEKEMPISIFKHFKAGLAYEMNNSSISAKQVYNTTTRNYDLDDRDDSTSYTIYLSDNMKGDLLDEYLDLGKTRFNWEFVYSYNSNSMTSIYNDETNDSNFSIDNLPSTFHLFDLYTSIFVGNDFKLESELLVKKGDYTTTDGSETLFQTLFVVEDEISFLQKTVGAGLDFGLAYTDDSKEDSKDPYVNLFNKSDNKNTLFANDYDIDLIFFKEIARATNLYFIKPHVKWRINREISVDLWSVSTFAFSSEETFGKDIYLGTELDLKAQFLNRDGLNFGIMGGFYLPGKGMDYLGANKERNDNDIDVNQDRTANYAVSVQAFMILKF